MHIYAVLICILKYCFIVELFEKWRSPLPPPPHSGNSFRHFGDSTLRFSMYKSAKSCRLTGGGGGGLGNPLAGFPPNTKN